MWEIPDLKTQTYKHILHTNYRIMNKSHLVLLSIITFTTLLSCNKDFDTNTQVPTIIGTWVFDKIITDKTKVYIKKDSFDLYKSGYTFNDDGTCILKLKTKCGNPPIFSEIEGDYIKTNDTLNIKYFNGRKNEFNSLFKSISKDTLKLIRIY